MSVSIAGLDAIQRGLERAPNLARRELLTAMTEATLLVEAQARDNMPRVTGLTAASATSDAWATLEGALGVVGSSQASAVALELGTRPHMPPSVALVPWVRAVLGVSAKDAPGVAYLVARKIARVGTPAQRPFGRALESAEAQIVRIVEAAAGRIAAAVAASGSAP